MAKKRRSPFFGIAIVALGYFGLKWFANTFSNGFKLGTIKLKIKALTTNLGVLLNVTIPIQNTNPVSINITDFAGAIWYGPVKIATIDQRQPILLLAQSTTDYIVEAEIDLKDLQADVKTQILGGNYLQAFFLKGTMKIGSISIPINEQITVLF